MDPPEVDCATVEVPLDWTKPSSGKVHIGLARRRRRWTVRDHAQYARMRARLAEEFPNIEWVQRVGYTMACVGGGTRTTNPQRPLDIDDAPPLLAVASLHDPATVYEWNLNVVRQSGAHLITYEGWGHTVYGGGGPSECVNDAVDAYLIDLRLPPPNLRCPSTDHPTTRATGPGRR